MLEAGISNRKCLTVDEGHTAIALGSGTLRVLGTPAMIALMEATASESVAPLLDAGCTSVGTGLDVAHVAAAPVGATVVCESVLLEVDAGGRRLTFRLSVRDHAGLVGEGTHERFVVDAERFMKKVENKQQPKEG